MAPPASEDADELARESGSEGQELHYPMSMSRQEAAMGQSERMIDLGLEMLMEEYGECAVQRALAAVRTFEVEIPSRVSGTFGGGRFRGYMAPGAAHSIEEELDPAALVHRVTVATAVRAECSPLASV